MTRPTVLALDTLDDRAQVRAALSHLLPTERVDFLDWCLDFARAVVAPPVRTLFASAVADRPRMARQVRAATFGDRDADARLTNEIYLDLCTLSHNWGVEFLPLLLEMEVWAKRRTVTPPAVAASSWARQSARPTPSVSPGTPARTTGSSG